MNMSINIMKNSGFRKTLPEKMFYNRYFFLSEKTNMLDFVLFKPNSKKVAGEIYLRKSDKNFRPDYSGSSIIVDYIAAYRYNKGNGTSLMNFAKKYSKDNGCNGYLVLSADPAFMPNKVPHTFYRKQGFTTLDESTDKKLDNFIKHNKNARHTDFLSMLMYYPAPQKNIKRRGLLGIYDNLMNLIKYYQT